MVLMLLVHINRILLFSNEATSFEELFKIKNVFAKVIFLDANELY